MESKPTTAPAATRLMTISDREFRLIQELVYQRFGINLTEAKKSLVVGRLQKIVRSMGMSTFKEYYEFLIKDKTGTATDALINRISTNHTFFYREHAHFDFFRSTILTDIEQMLSRSNARDIRIWCAGCSSGEEPYMLVMIMLDLFGPKYGSFSAGVLATDISARALNRAVKGVYSDENMAHVPPFAKKYFQHMGPDQWAVCDRVKNEVVFRRFNLMNEKFPFKKPFHTIFCRNVMIYFDQETRSRLITRFHHHLLPGGYFLIGHSESLGREQGLYSYVMPAVYKKI